mmetsp:Transcript_129674/g.415946  ORF Transcript_129674/g.415946 Transcript_129674/m.415946 type:complete len:241 (-) Transcript_129674:124-846(-)|eukprot:CAMPEP_0203847574 /NCGR_PEP_ID=MMETSP0359-20131031/5092_1 /ASSEMBLY_ACC=CAM_ASM_000338 /TAXON_ID=268821 /ORGANISM="Scrippsiella Hangoei, Strain SHTV-5" /LENGTH=240 /DNA_ID=CAMNT_0050763051 /DNA_START=55 /DNA_END=777 /DNA_ORIENTATION=-
MGNTVLTTQKIACGHTDRHHLQQSLLCDRLSNPTAEMAEALLALQGRTVLLQRFADRDAQSRSPPAGDADSRQLLLLAMSYCILFGYQCPGDVAGAAARPAGALGRSFEPAEPADFVRAFESVLRRPPDLLQDLLGLRAQVIPRDTLMRIAPLVEDSDCLGPDAFSGPFAEALRPLVVFLHAVVESGEIYAEIQDSVAAGRFDKQQAASLMEGEVSDQRRMINAMGVRGFEENELQDGYE